MKKTLLMLSLLSFSFLATSCNNTDIVTKSTYEISFIVDGKEILKEYVKEGETVNKPTKDPFKDGYNFLGRFTSSNCLTNELFNFNDPVTKALTLYAGFSEIVEETKFFQVNLNLNGGEFIENQELTFNVEENTLIPKPIDPFKNGYNFLYWCSDSSLENKFDFETTYIRGDINLYAKYKLVEVSTKYEIISSSDLNEGYRADFACDDNEESYWKAKDNGKQNLFVDLKEIKEVTFISQEFADLSNWNFKIEGSVDNNLYVDLLVNDRSTTGALYSRNIDGYYRYIKLTIEENDILASSKEFNIEFNSLQEGTNIAYGSKGIADCWAAGFESEIMFDGKLDKYHCANQYHENHYMGIDMSEEFYVTSVEMFMQDKTDHKFIIDFTNDGSNWSNLAGSDFNSNNEQKDYFKLPVNETLKTLLVHYNGNSTGNWPAMKEFKVNGFKLNNEFQIDNNVIDLGNTSYLSRINKTNLPQDVKFEISTDGKEYKEISPVIEKDYYVFNDVARFLKLNTEEALNKESIKLYSLSFNKNLSLLTSPHALGRNENDPGFLENMMVLNKDCKEAQSRFYCSKASDFNDLITLDFGINVYANNIVYKYQDYKEENCYKLIIEVSEDNKEFKKVLDTTDNEFGASKGQTFKASLKEEDKRFRYLKISTQMIGGYTNCNSLEINGLGEPIK